MEKQKLYFTEITEDEKRIINLIRTYIAPLEDISEYVDFLVDHTASKLLEKTVDLHAFMETMQHERQSDLSNMQLLARLNMFRDYISNNEEQMKRYMAGIFTDIVKNLEGDIKPIEVYSQQDRIDEEEKVLDKINNQ